MSRRVQIASGYSDVTLPDGRQYSAYDETVLTDEQFAQVDSDALGTIVLDLGSVGGSGGDGGLPVGRAPATVHDQADDGYGIGAYKVFQVPADTDGPVYAVGLVGDEFPRWLLTGYGLYVGDGTVDPYGGSPALNGGVDEDGNVRAETHAPWLFTQPVIGINRIQPTGLELPTMHSDGYTVNMVDEGHGIALAQNGDVHARMILFADGTVAVGDGTVDLFLGPRVSLGTPSLPVADLGGVVIDTTTYDNTVTGSGKMSTVVGAPGTGSVPIMAWALNGDAFPRVILLNNPQDALLYIGDGTYDPYSTNHYFAFSSGRWNIQPGLDVSALHITGSDPTLTQVDEIFDQGTGPVVTAPSDGSNQRRLGIGDDGSLISTKSDDPTNVLKAAPLPPGAIVDTTTYDDTSHGSGKFTTVVMPDEDTLLAFAVAGDVFPRLVIGQNVIYMGDGTFDVENGASISFDAANKALSLGGGFGATKDVEVYHLYAGLITSGDIDVETGSGVLLRSPSGYKTFRLFITDEDGTLGTVEVV